MLIFTKTATNLNIAGKTFPIKELLKTLDARWDPSILQWTLPIHLDSEHLRNTLTQKLEDNIVIEKVEKKKAIEFARSPEGIAMVKNQIEEKRKTGAYHWICCDECEVIDWRRQHTSCKACAEFDGQSWNSFRVSGRLYTGT